jgi:hypothetical protein
VIVKNLSGNADMYVGGSGFRPYSGYGFNLAGGEAVALDISDFNLIYLCSTTSGQKVTFIGVA